MATIEIRIPQLGEGLQEARLVRFLKQPGDAVAQDEPIYEMETDKAVMEIEAPASGVLEAWTAAPDDVLPIGASIGRIAQDAGAPSSSPHQGGITGGSAAPEQHSVAEEQASSAVPNTQHPTPNTQSSVEIRIPQLGEGLQEARLVRFLKQPGDQVAQDEPIYEMETDKAVMEIESPAAGVLEAWNAAVDDVLPIGASIGSIRTESAVSPGEGMELLVSEAPIGESAEAKRAADLQQKTNEDRQPAEGGQDAAETGASLRNGQVSPRARARAAALGVVEAEIAKLARRLGRRVRSEDIDALLAGRHPGESPSAKPTPPSAGGYRDEPLPGRQKTLNFRLQRSAQSVIPATMEMPLDWEAVEAVRASMKARQGDAAPTQFLLFAWCVAQAVKSHPRFLCALANEATLRQYDHLHLGIAVARPGDELLMARISNADALDFPTFVATAQDAIHRARDGEDQTAEAMQLSLTNMASAGVRTGIPVVVAPSAGTLFIGAPYHEAYPLPVGGIAFRRTANMVFTFDHRIANGVGAARFLADIQARVHALRSEFGEP